MSAGKFVVTAALVAAAHADVYLHAPRGSNNRLNERSATRNNGNRMFDSQNNNRGGYNKGDIDDTAAGNDWTQQYDMQYYQSETITADGGKTQMTIEWTNQHGCGGNEQGDPHKLNCDIIIQYQAWPVVLDRAAQFNSQYDYLDRSAAQLFDATGGSDAIDTVAPFSTPRSERAVRECFIPNPSNPTCDMAAPGRMACGAWSGVYTNTLCTRIGGVWRDSVSAGGMWDEYNTPQTTGTPYTYRAVRDGTTTNRQQFTNGQATETVQQTGNRKNGDVDDEEGYHETWEWYNECYRRERNGGLFTADQNLRNNNFGYKSAVFTRQNPNNNRRGYECPEERDYYPYWHPTPWRDIAVLTDRLDRCDFYQSESQNVQQKGVCRNTAQCQNCNRWNNQARCEAMGGRWAVVGSWNTSAPDCIQAPWSRVNQLGNGRYGQANTYNWTLPSFTNPSTGEGFDVRIVVRLRYNISTDDYNGATVNNSFNNNNGQNIQSPVRQNPAVDIGAFNTALRLAINTNQFGRTFQDRSHAIALKARPTSTTDAKPYISGTGQTEWTTDPNVDPTFFRNRDILNINVRGKRCNIVQCFPSVEYDFYPNQVQISTEDIVHFQWTGSNTHNNGNPAGDGQAGDAGEGTRGTDRHNVVEMLSRSPTDFGASFPSTWERNTMWNNIAAAYSPEPIIRNEDASETLEQRKVNWAIRMASVGYYKNFAPAPGVGTYTPRNSGNIGTDTLSVLLNNAPASYPGGMFRFRAGNYNYMCTRNHNFSNRDQKAQFTVVNATTSA
mmetsp:Transcript_26330/g.69184  ORF Transcript_26330/g.69184 Transcript_26330/m.69184 type:complete len:779 (-) Transcript_26330:235-2571(-)|eukprot:CAMPEP_0182924390 /NCGR_PEP_ID=MMETSP0105_2-20130417/6010_1 /TAXON_ID=81532 ORGANISM="Acanthoeca-like sp., Strain 10tr" /NCGR_SAMPLE_ID=MMETSP0105_2 /ASSEMBLY_ACC=CAM_ASM_000205 /LENGTH=778 /DNA_ID=CAMNT_0025062161 /DNA_START=229 /DNA_END=2565 /DNA_ORIENTATION=+